MEQPTVTRINQTQVIKPDGTLVPTFVVSFTVGAHGPFTTQIPASDFNAANVKQKMQDVADTINQLPAGA